MIGCRSVCSKKLISHEITKYSLFPMIFSFFFKYVIAIKRVSRKVNLTGCLKFKSPVFHIRAHQFPGFFFFRKSGRGFVDSVIL